MYRDKLVHKIAMAEAERNAQVQRGHGVEALASNIRIQALREALSLWDGKELPPNEMIQSGGQRTTDRPPDRVVHVKRGTSYTVLTRDGFVQTDQPLQDMDAVAIYRCDKSGAYVARRASEMDDGRFLPAS